MRICELKQKEVINIHTCRSLGCPLDVEFCCETARLKALDVYKRQVHVNKRKPQVLRQSLSNSCLS